MAGIQSFPLTGVAPVMSERKRRRIMKNVILIPAALVGLGVGMAVANAAPPAGTAARSGQASVIVQAAERDCIRDEKGWHYMEKDRRRDCRPKRPEGRDWGWKCKEKRCGWWHAKENRWHDG
jgi:hypothetical protein